MIQISVIHGKGAKNFVIQSHFFQALSLKFQTARKNTCLAILFYLSRATKRHMDRRKVQFSLVTPIHGDRWRNLPLFRKPLCRALQARRVKHVDFLAARISKEADSASMQISMYLSTQLHYTQNVDDNSLCRLDIKARMLPAGVPFLPQALQQSNRVLAFPSLYIRHSTSRRGSSVGQKQPPPHSSTVFLHLRVLLRTSSHLRRRDFTTLSCSLPQSRALLLPLYARRK